MTVVKLAGTALVCLGAAVGCYNHTYTVGSGGNAEGDATYDHWESHWFFGIIGGPEIDLNKVCPSGNATIKDEVSFLNGLVGAFIGIVWYPSTVEIYCGQGKAASITLTPEQMRAVAVHPKTLSWARTVSPAKAAELESAVHAYREMQANVATTTSGARF